MFEIGFSELILVAVISLLVIGPKRLPETVRSVALWISRFRRATSKIYQEMEREVGMDDIRRQLHNEEVMERLRDLEKAKQELERDAIAPLSPTPPAATDGQKP